MSTINGNTLFGAGTIRHTSVDIKSVCRHKNIFFDFFDMESIAI
jgi:hypothetical protein